MLAALGEPYPALRIGPAARTMPAREHTRLPAEQSRRS
jgi:hypothetical protein